MSRAPVPPLAALALLLAGCPIPQPLPEYTAGSVTPPRIKMQTVVPASDSVIRVGVDCPTTGADEPTFEMTAQLFDSNNVEQIVARWFVNYDTNDAVTVPAIGGDIAVPPPSNSTTFERSMPTLPFGPASPFHPFDYRPPIATGTLTSAPFNEAGTIRIVELLVSNSFKSGPTSATNRDPSPNFEVAVQRWVFLLVPGTENCGPHPIP